MATNQVKDITIESVVNGFIIRVGCARLVSMSKESMLHEIGRYIDDPSGVEKQYAANALNQGAYQPDNEPDNEPDDRADVGEDEARPQEHAAEVESDQGPRRQPQAS